MAVSKEDLIETLSNMSILEVTDLVSELEENGVYLRQQRLRHPLPLPQLGEKKRLLRMNLML